MTIVITIIIVILYMISSYISKNNDDFNTKRFYICIVNLSILLIIFILSYFNNTKSLNENLLLSSYVYMILAVRSYFVKMRKTLIIKKIKHSNDHIRQSNLKEKLEFLRTSKNRGFHFFYISICLFLMTIILNNNEFIRSDDEFYSFVAVTVVFYLIFTFIQMIFYLIKYKIVTHHILVSILCAIWVSISIALLLN